MWCLDIISSSGAVRKHGLYMIHVYWQYLVDVAVALHNLEMLKWVVRELPKISSLPGEKISEIGLFEYEAIISQWIE